jgi:hypothetical protein
MSDCQSEKRDAKEEREFYQWYLSFFLWIFPLIEIKEFHLSRKERENIRHFCHTK